MRPETLSQTRKGFRAGLSFPGNGFFFRVYTVKKISFLPNPPKRFRRYLKASKCVQRLKKMIVRIYETLKGSVHGHTFGTIFYETFFRCTELKIGFVEDGSECLPVDRSF